MPDKKKTGKKPEKKIVAKKAVAKKAVGKKPTAKKPVKISLKKLVSKKLGKKAIAKKPVAKKPVAKKATAKKPAKLALVGGTKKLSLADCKVMELPNFLSRSDCNEIVGFFQQNIAHYASENPEPAFSGRQINYGRIPDHLQVKRIINFCRWRVAEEIRRFFAIPHLYPDYTDIVYWGDGENMPVHADNSYQDGSPGRFPWRTHSAVIYLNDDYNGGETFFPNLKVTSKAECGKCIAFGAGIEYSHGVKTIMGGNRYTLPIWFTDNSSYLEV